MRGPKVEFLDRLGITASVICVLHCAVTPLLLLILPFASHELSHSNLFHVIMAVIIAPTAIWALWRGYRIHHKRTMVMVGTMGLTFILAGLLTHQDFHGFILTAVGGVMLVTAHLKNLRACQKCRLQA